MPRSPSPNVGTKKKKTSNSIDLSNITRPSLDQLRQFERDPNAALCALVVNSGLDNFHQIDKLFWKTNSVGYTNSETTKVLE